MVRRLLTARWLGLHLLAVALVGAFVVAGFWQLGRARAFLGPAAHTDPAAVDLATVSPSTGSLPPDSAGRRVRATGVFDTAHAFTVPDRTRGALNGSTAGPTGQWVVGVLRLSDGSGVCVLRGWAPAGAGTAPPPPGTVTVTGRLEPSEPVDGGQPPGSDLGAGQLAAVNPVDLLGIVAYPVHDGFVVAGGGSPVAAPLQSVPAPGPGVSVPGFFLQHAGYVGLWWLFALFVIAFWVRLVRDELTGGAVTLASAQQRSPMPGSGAGPAPG